MKRALSKEEFAEKLRLEMEEHGKHTSSPEKYKAASVQMFGAFTQISSYAVYGLASFDPEGYNRYLPPETRPVHIARETREALNNSRFITPDHPEWDIIMRFSTAAEINELETARLARAGLKTLKALYNGAGNISITHRANKISIKPWCYRGRSYWEGIHGQEDIILPETATDAELGAAIAAGLEISRKA